MSASLSPRDLLAGQFADCLLDGLAHSEIRSTLPAQLLAAQGILGMIDDQVRREKAASEARSHGLKIVEEGEPEAAASINRQAESTQYNAGYQADVTRSGDSGKLATCARRDNALRTWLRYKER